MSTQRAFRFDNGEGEYWAWAEDNTEMPPCGQVCRHVTAEEAERHFYDWAILGAQESPAPEGSFCIVPDCGKPAAVTVRTAWLLRPTFFCKDHDSARFLREIYAFVPARRIDS